MVQSQKTRVLSIYGYTDYRKYLNDYYHFRKDSVRGYSFRKFSKEAGFSSPNYLKMVIDGQRNLSNEAVEKFLVGLHLNGPMADYFRQLVKMNQAKSDDERELHLKALQKLIPNSKRRILSPEAYTYLSHWLYSVIREMALLPDFSDDPYWVVRRLNADVSVAEVASTLKFLTDEGFLVKLADGRYQANDDMVISSDEVKSLAVRNYHREMVERAKECLTNLPVHEREFGALTLLLPNAAIQELKYKIKAFRKEIHLWAMQVLREEKGEAVVQLNFQMFPHTRGATTK